MPTSRRELENRAQQAILKSIVEDYKQRRADWQKDPSIRKAILSQSFFRTLNALLLAAGIIIAAVGTIGLAFVMGFVGLVVGGIGGLVGLGLIEALFLYQSFKNEELHNQAVAEMLRPKVDINRGGVKDIYLRKKLDKALEYWALIDETLEKAPEGVIRDRLVRTTREVAHWLQAVYNLAERVDQFRTNKVVERDLQALPKTIAEYKRRLAAEDSPEVKTQLERTIADKERQLHTLQALEDNIEKADYQLESTISSLGTIYSQLLLVGNKDEAGSRISRLQEEVTEQVEQLEDLAEAMDEVYRDTV